MKSVTQTVPAASDVLLRLANGESRTHDLASLSVPLEGSRLVVARSRQIGLIGHLHSAGHRRQFHACVIPDTGVMGLVACRHAEATRKESLAVASGVLRFDPDASIGISSVLGGLGDLPAAYREATELAEMVEMGGTAVGRCLVVEDCWASLALRRLVPLLSETLPADNPIERLRRYDSSRRGDLTHSVYTWIMCNCAIDAAAKQLFVHPNTLRYRLQRAEQISGLDLGDADERALFQLAYKASEAVEAADRPASIRLEAV